MHFVLAALTAPQAAALARLSRIPAEFWWKLALGLGILIAAVLVLRHVAKMNRLVLGLGLFLLVTTIGFNWIHDRNEPAWATPVVQVVAGFLPGKVSG
jgi:apolipoprotein N-acyltransferase